MSANTVLTAFEHQRVRVDGTTFRKCHLSALDRWNSGSPRPVMQVARNDVRLSQYVGVIQVGDLTIEILPKVGRSDEDNLVHAKWRVALLDMLEIAGVIRSTVTSDASLLTTPRSLLDILFNEYLERTREVVARGLSKTYSSTEAHLAAVRGRILLAQNATRNHVHRERHYCKYDIFTADNLLNRILKAATEVAARSSMSPTTAARAKELLLHFDNVRKFSISFHDLDSATLNRKTEHYAGALSIAKLILRGVLPSLETGADPVVAILFDMNELYELYVLRLFKGLARRTSSMRIRSQRGMRFWETKVVRPDIQIDYGGRRIIVDTKWKVPSGGTPSDADLKQMFAYHRVFQSRESYLLYPKTVDSASPRTGRYSEGSGQCTMEYIELFDDRNRIRREADPDLLQLVTTCTAEIDSEDRQ